MALVSSARESSVGLTRVLESSPTFSAMFSVGLAVPRGFASGDAYTLALSAAVMLAYRKLIRRGKSSKEGEELSKCTIYTPELLTMSLVQDASSRLQELLMNYIHVFGTRPVCFSDIKKYLTVIPMEQRNDFILRSFYGITYFKITTLLCTVCPRSSDPFYILIYYTKWVTTSFVM